MKIIGNILSRGLIPSGLKLLGQVSRRLSIFDFPHVFSSQCAFVSDLDQIVYPPETETREHRHIVLWYDFLSFYIYSYAITLVY